METTFNSPERFVITTGVLGREPGTITAVANVVNLNRRPNAFVEVELEVFDWTTFEPRPLVVKIGDFPIVGPYLLAPQHLAILYSTDLDALGVEQYEMRLTLSRARNIVVNCFGRGQGQGPNFGPPFPSQEGDTVLNNELVRLRLRKCDIPLC